MDLTTTNTFGQFQSSSSEDEQAEEVESSSDNSAICAAAFVPVATDDCLNMDEQPSEDNAASNEDDVTIASSEGSAIEEQLNERIAPLPQYKKSQKRKRQIHNLRIRS